MRSSVYPVEQTFDTGSPVGPPAPIDGPVKVLAILLAVANLVVVAAVALFMWFIAAFPWENSDDPTGDDWLMPVAIVLATASLGLLVSVCASWTSWAAGALVFQTVIIVSLLSYALEGSSHSDGKLVALALGIEAAAVGAWLLLLHHVRTPRRRPGY
jgi:hypothetical protein